MRVGPTEPAQASPKRRWTWTGRALGLAALACVAGLGIWAVGFRCWKARSKCLHGVGTGEVVESQVA